MNSTNLLRGLVIVGLLMTSGCASFWHDMQPHRLRRLNRHPAPSMDPEFSGVQQVRPLSETWETPSDMVVRAQR